MQRPLDQMMLKKDSEIASPKDLEGQTVGYSSSEVREAIVKAMVKNDGGDPEKVSFVDVGFDLIPLSQLIAFPLLWEATSITNYRY